MIFKPSAMYSWTMSMNVLIFYKVLYVASIAQWLNGRFANGRSVTTTNVKKFHYVKINHKCKKINHKRKNISLFCKNHPQL